MHSSHSTSALQALYRVFVLPALSSPTAAIQHCRPLLHQTSTRTAQSLPQLRRRFFSTTPSRAVKTRAPELRTQKWDEEISHQLIYLVDPATQLREEEPRTRFDVLNTLDRNTHRLVQLSPESSDPEFVPTCKVMSKKEQYNSDKKRLVQAKEKKKEASKVNSVKTLELNWAIDGNDLQHRLDRAQEFLGEGRRVEVVLAAKKRGRKATPTECEALLKKIQGVVEAVPGAKEFRKFEGKVGGFATLVLQGQAPSQQVKREGAQSS